MGHNVSFDDAEAAFNKADVSRTGVLSFEEFLNWQRDNVKSSGLPDSEIQDLFKHLAETCPCLCLPVSLTRVESVLEMLRQSAACAPKYRSLDFRFRSYAPVPAAVISLPF